MRFGLLLAVLTFFTVLAYGATTAYPEVPLVIDGKAVDFMSVHMLQHMPVLMVDGYAMAPIRLFDEELGLHLDMHLESWNIYMLDQYAFKPGEKITYWPVAGFDGDRPTSAELPIAPRIINGRLYLPARAVFSLVGYDTVWDGGVIRVNKRTKTVP